MQGTLGGRKGSLHRFTIIFAMKEDINYGYRKFDLRSCRAHKNGIINYKLECETKEHLVYKYKSFAHC